MNGQPQPQGQQQIQIKIPDDVMKGVPANMTGISHTKQEFVLDFINIYPAQRQGIVSSRVVVTPGHMKQILKAFEDNIKKYEDKHGKIKEAETPQKDEIGFQAA